jgi:hypothetical protein
MNANRSAAAKKEGAKKAQAFSSLHKLGGLLYFCASADTAEGDIDVLVDTLAGVNADKKAVAWGKFLISCNDRSVCAVGHVPKELVSEKGLDAKEWAGRLMDTTTSFAGCCARMVNDTLMGDEEFVKFIIDVDPAAETFPFKLCDALVTCSTAVLKEKGLVAAPPSCPEDDDDEIDYSDAAGITW